MQTIGSQLPPHLQALCCTLPDGTLDAANAVIPAPVLTKFDEGSTQQFKALTETARVFSAVLHGERSPLSAEETVSNKTIEPTDMPTEFLSALLECSESEPCVRGTYQGFAFELLYAVNSQGKRFHPLIRVPTGAAHAIKVNNNSKLAHNEQDIMSLSINDVLQIGDAAPFRLASLPGLKAEVSTCPYPRYQFKSKCDNFDFLYGNGLPGLISRAISSEVASARAESHGTSVAVRFNRYRVTFTVYLGANCEFFAIGARPRLVRGLEKDSIYSNFGCAFELPVQTQGFFYKRYYDGTTSFLYLDIPDKLLRREVVSPVSMPISEVMELARQSIQLSESPGCGAKEIIALHRKYQFLYDDMETIYNLELVPGDISSMGRPHDERLSGEAGIIQEAMLLAQEAHQKS